MSDNLLDQLTDDAKTAYYNLYEQFKAILKDARFRPRITDTEKRQEFLAFLDLPDTQQAQLLGELTVAGIDAEKLLMDRQKLMEG